MPELHTTVPESLLLRSPKASEGSGGALGEAEALRRGNTVGVRDQVMDLVAEQGLKVSRVDLLMTPTAVEGDGGAVGERVKIAKGHYVMLRDQVKDLVDDQELLPTPNTMEHREIKTPEQIAELKAKSPGGYRNLREVVVNEIDEPVLMPTPSVAHIRNHDESIEGYLERRQDYLDGKTKGMFGVSLGVAVRMETDVDSLMPTPTTRDYKDGQAPHLRDGVVQTDTVGRAVMNSGEIELLQTPQVDDSKNTGHNQTRRKTLASQIWETSRTISWGKFEPAIRRWEAMIDRPAPAPTLPDGRDGAHRLSPWLCEWMMGLPEGWICDPEIGLTRNQMLKAAGNGVVPQQAYLALEILGVREILGLDTPNQ
jgi:site-specific DNA-cytosine methylase